MQASTRKIDLSRIHCFLFDLDDTLYPHDSGVWEVIRERIDQYMLEEMHFPAEQIPGLRHRLWKQYGTTLRGLQAEYQVDMDAYLRYVHTVPLHEFLKPDPDLSATLSSLPQPKCIFTNSDATHAKRILDHLDITHHFQRFIDIYDMAPHCKPQKEAFLKALEILDQEPENCALIDDSPVNLETAHQLGFTTISVGTRIHDGSPHIEKVTDLSTLLTGPF
jgi:putative hydrolase of the HAD superfamily